MPDLLTLAVILVIAAIGWVTYDWDTYRAWWIGRRKRKREQYQQQLQTDYNGRVVAMRTFTKMKAR
jgi:hypothetical protein